MISFVAGFLVAYTLLNGFCWALGSSMRFGWYNKEDERIGQGHRVLDNIFGPADKS